MTTLLNPQIVGQAENAHRPPLERILGRTGTSFPQWVALRLTAADGGTADRARLAARMADALKIEPELARLAIDQLIGARLLEEKPRPAPDIRLTDAGRTRFTEIKSAVDEVVSQVYSTIPRQDLETAARVLTTLTERLNALAA
jgi:DNA-binding MarR family transcriptional regulator